MNIAAEDAREIWARLGEEGKAPSELTFAAGVLPLYSVALDPWIDRLNNTYLKSLSRKHAHFKLAIAPYGGGKTHFLMALGSRALKEDFAVSYIACKAGINLDSPMDIYRSFMKGLQLRKPEKPGTLPLLQTIIENKNEEIKNSGAPDPEAAFAMWVQNVANDEYPELAFGRVMAEALRFQIDPTRDVAGEAAIRWLRGEIDTLTKTERESLRLAKVSKKDQTELGRNLLLSVLCFVKEAGAHGTVVLFDEVETLFNARGRALQRVLAAMRVMLDQAGGITGGVPLFGVFAAVPDILEQIRRYEAVSQRLEVKGAPFEEGNNYAPQLHLEKVDTQKNLLEKLGERLISLGEIAIPFVFNQELQCRNIGLLARVASESNLEIDARRLFVKACVNILQQQSHQGEVEYPEDEMLNRYRGFFDDLRNQDRQEFEP